MLRIRKRELKLSEHVMRKGGLENITLAKHNDRPYTEGAKKKKTTAKRHKGQAVLESFFIVMITHVYRDESQKKSVKDYKE